MIKVPRYLGTYLIVMAFFGLTIFTVIYRPKLSMPPTKEAGLPDFSFEDVIVSHIYDGDLVWEVESDSAAIYKENNVVNMYDAQGDIYENDKPAVRFQAPVARIFMHESDMELSDATAEFYLETKKVTLFSKVLNWYAEVKQFVGREYVKVETEDIELVGEAFHVDIPVQRMKVAQNAKASIEVREE
jgi:hypothetical protein